MKKILFILLVLQCPLAFASKAQLGITVGPTFVRNEDFNGANAQTDLHFTAGMGVSYPIGCQGRFCHGLFLEPGFSYTFPATTQFGSTRISSTGLTGDYSESLKIYSGNLNIKKHFRAGRKLTLFALGGVGISYFQLSQVRFIDALGTALPLNVSTSSLNPNLNLGAGLAFEASEKLLIDFRIIPHIVFADIMEQSYFTMPIGLHYAF